jgi:hypothetical protein
MKKYLNENDYFSTSDLSLATVIYYFGGKIEVVDRSNPGRAVFIFLRSDDLDRLIQDFWSKSLLIEPQTYFSGLKELKTRLYQG